MKEITRILMLFVSAAALILGGCKEENEDRAVLTSAVTTIEADGGEFRLAISANGTWLLEKSEDWVTLNKVTGSGDEEVVMLVLRNMTTAERKFSVTLKSGSKAMRLTFVQRAGEASWTVEDNGNTDEAARGLEYPHLKAGNVFVQHFATIAGEKRVNYAIEWNVGLKHAEWVAYTFDTETIKQNIKRTDNWSEDFDLPAEMRTDNSYHTSDGFDRGHLCASADRLYSAETSDQTFYYSNMSPQLNGFNAGIWERMEEEVRKWGKEVSKGEVSKVYVCKGGTLNKLLKYFTGANKGMDGKTPTTDANGLTVKGLPCPAYYFMAILKETKTGYVAMAFLVPHDDRIKPQGGGSSFTVADMKKYAVSIDKLEEESGIDFFCNLADEVEASVEGSYDENAWQW